MSGVRAPAVAGLFYPADPDVLAATVCHHLARAVAHEPEPIGHLRGLVVPHAGYVYSGPTAGVGYRLLPGLGPRVERVLLLGPPHRVAVAGVEVSAADAWQVPGVTMQVDGEGRDLLVARAAQQNRAALVAVGDSAHAPEHSLEVQVPFLAATLPSVPVLPVLVGGGDPSELADLFDVWWDESSLIVVSTDLSHYEPDAQARVHDARTSAVIQSGNVAALGDHDACGAHPLRVLLTLARRHGAAIRELDLRTSADTAGSPDRVVGYGAFSVEV